MARQPTGKVHVGESRTTLKNGTTYVYERVTRYDPETRKTVAISSRLKGKIMPGGTEVVPTRRKMPNGLGRMPVPGQPSADLAGLLRWAGEASGIDEDLRGCFPPEAADRIISVARFWLATDGADVSRLRTWQMRHPTPFEEPLDDAGCHRLFEFLEEERRLQGRFFCRRRLRLSGSPAAAYDVAAAAGDRLEDDFAPDEDEVSRLLVLYSVQDEEPIAFVRAATRLNSPDVASLADALEEFACFDVDQPLLTTDVGLCGEAGIRELCRRKLRFLTSVDMDSPLARDAVDALREELDSAPACPFDGQARGAARTVVHAFGAGPGEAFRRKLHLAVFRFDDLREWQESVFRDDLRELKGLVEAGVTTFTEEGRRKIDRFLVRTRPGRGRKPQVAIDEEECARAGRYFGHAVMAGDAPREVFAVLADRRLRECFEDAFPARRGSRRRSPCTCLPASWQPGAPLGRIFVQFVTLCYRCFLLKRIKAVRRSLEEEPPAKNRTGSRLRLRKSLGKWLDEHPLPLILDWLDCAPEMCDLRNPIAAHRWSLESVARDRLLLELLRSTP